MFISHLYKEKACVFSLEVFPPKKTASKEKLYDALQEMATLKPDFISVTYGAGGTSGGMSTCEIAEYIQNSLHIPALAHLTCVGATPLGIRQKLAELHQGGIHNILLFGEMQTPSLLFKKSFAMPAIWHRKF